MIDRDRISKSTTYYADALLRRAKWYVRRIIYTMMHQLGMTSTARFEECSDDDIVFQQTEREVLILDRPASNVDLPYGITSKIGAHTINGSSVVVKKSVRLLGSNLVPFDEENNILGYSFNAESYKDLLVHINASALVASIRKSHDYKILEYACCLVNAWSTSYFHWLVELLPRLLVLQDYPDTSHFPMNIIINPKPTTWQLKSLELLGIPHDRIVCSDKPLYVRQFFIPSFPLRIANGKRFSVISPEIITRMRNEILANLKIDPAMPADRKIIVSRKKATGRKVVNEAHLAKELSKYGFELFVLEDMSFEEQINLFAQAKAVIAPHGAGLTNLIFSTSDLRVIELYSGEWNWNPSFYTLASSLGLDYALFKCERISSINRKRDNMLVDVARFLQFYEDLEQQPTACSDLASSARTFTP